MVKMNKALMIGRVVSEIKSKPGYSRCRFVVVNKFKDKEGKFHENQEFFNLVGFGTLADRFNQEVKMHDQVNIEARLQSSTYNDNEQVTRRSYSLIMETFQITQRKEKDTQPYYAPVPDNI